MFKRLRNKFLILNLVIISVAMIFAFSAIYLMTYNNVQRDIDMELHKISDFGRKPNEAHKDPMPGVDKSVQPPERSVSFTLITSKQGTITDYVSIFEMNTDIINNAKNIALSKTSEEGRFKLEGNYWAFIKIPYSDGYRITFLDITSRQGILINLIYTFLIVAFVMLIVIFFISSFFANKSIRPIKDAFDRQKQFIADASHELKTPLAVINTNVDVLLSNGGESIDSQSKWLNYIKSETERMAKLTKDLLYLTQVDYSEVKMIFSDFDLSDAVENVVLTMEAIIFENNASLNYDIEPAILIHGNSEQLKQVTMILLDNALKYANDNGSIEVTLKKNYGNIILSVSNTGKGIPKESIGRIFDRFYRVDKSRSRESGGYGLGLAIAKTIVEQHGGKISVESIPDKLTTFSVELSGLR